MVHDKITNKKEKRTDKLYKSREEPPELHEHTIYVKTPKKVKIKIYIKI